MSRVIRVSAAILALGVLGNAYAGVDINNYNFIVIDEGPRAAAMGGAGYALAEGCAGALLGPAGLAQTVYPQFAFDATPFANYYSVNASFAGWGWGGNFRYFDLSDGFINSYPPLTAFGDQGFILGAGYGRRLGPRLALGGGPKIISLNYGSHGAQALAVDIGASYKLKSNLTVAGGAKNLGGELKWMPEQDNEHPDAPAPRYVPSAVVAGVGWTLWEGRFVTACDFHVPVHPNEFAGLRGDAVYGRFGMEYWPWRWFAVRGGYRSGLDELGSFITLGTGFRFGSFDVDLAIGPGKPPGTYYSFAGNERDIPGGLFAFGLTYSFGRSRVAGFAGAEEKFRRQFEEQKMVMVSQLLGQAEKFQSQKRYGDVIDTVNIILVWDPDNAAANEMLTAAETAYNAQQVQEHIARAKDYFAGGNLADAALEAKAALALDAENSEAASLLAAAEEKLADERETAAAATAQSLSDAQRLYERGDYAGAIAKWSAVLAGDPGNRVAASSIGAAQARMTAEENKYLGMASAAESGGRTTEAIRYYKAALAANPTSVEGKAGLARLQAQVSATADELAEKAAAALAAKDYDRAESLASDALSYNANHPQAKRVLKTAAAARREKAAGKSGTPSYHGIYLKGIQAYTEHNYAAAVTYWQQIPAGDALYAKAVQNIKRAKAVLAKLEQ